MAYDFFEFKIGNDDFSFFWQKEFRKSIGLKISPELELFVKSPLSMEIEDIKLFLQKHIEWIKKHRISTPKIKPMTTGCNKKPKIVFLGNEYSLKVKLFMQNIVILRGKSITFFSTKPKNQPHTSKNIEIWIRDQAELIFQERINECLKLFPKLKQPKLKIKDLNGRYGSYSASHEITLNLRLIKASIELIDYVVIHELCHAYHMNHGKEFKDLLTVKLPNWKLLKEKLVTESILRA